MMDCDIDWPEAPVAVKYDGDMMNDGCCIAAHSAAVDYYFDGDDDGYEGACSP